MLGLLAWILLIPAENNRHAQEDASADRIKTLKADLRRAGIRVSSSYATLASESKLRSAVSRVTKLRRPMIKAGKDLEAVEARLAGNEEALLRLTRANVELNARLANVTIGDVATNNRLVGLINANNGQIRLLNAQKEQLNSAAARARATAIQAREDYVGHILSLRPQSTNVREQYKKQQQDGKIAGMLAELGRLNGKPLELKPSKAFESAVQQITKLETSVRSESIPLRRAGKALYVSVVINGKAREMIIDSGSSLISLPWNVARDLGIKVKPTDQPVVARLADGREIRATKVILPSVRVGGFTAKNVACCVLGPEARSSEPLLGMSFLEKFRFEVRANEAVLSMRDAKAPPARGTKP